jgi:RsiW-degrading membrane proteinase PrsW (M82 family)
MKRGIWFAGVVAAIATCTWVVGWWMVPVVAGIYGFVRRDDAATPLLAGLAGMVAWGVLLAFSATGAPAGSVSDAVGRAMRVGPGPLMALTLIYPALLAASAAALVKALARPRPGAQS